MPKLLISRRLLGLHVGLAVLTGLSCAPNIPKQQQAGSLAVPQRHPQAQADAPLPLDPAVIKGQLPNGMTYYLRKNQRPENRAALRLVVNAGSVLEDDDQQGLAHFIEHMAFNGTKLFEKHEILNTLEKAGVKFGSHTNAYTSFDETVYMLEVPTDDEALLSKALLILQQFASDVSFDPEEVEKERGVVVEEWRSGRGAETRVMDQQLKVLFKGSRYADRLPIGEKKTLETAPVAALKRFYNDWYRPNLMAVIAVGDFDPAKVEAEIRKVFEPLKNPPNARPRPEFSLPGHEQTRVSIATDKELPQTSLAVVNTMPVRGKSTHSDYRRMMLESLYHQIMNARLSELTRAADAPFLMAMSATQSFSRASDVFLQMAMINPLRTQEALSALTREIERVERFGFTEGELDRARGSVLRTLESLVQERQKTPSGQLADEMVRNFLTAEAMPGIEAELTLHQQFLPKVEVEKLNRLASAWVGEKNRVLLLSGPAKAPLPQEKELLSTFAKVQQETLEAYVDRIGKGPLVAEPPTPGKIVSEKRIENVNVTMWTLSNGMRVAFKPTDFRNDEVFLGAFSPGGHSQVSLPEYPSAVYADAVVSEGGLGSYDPVELEKALSGKLASVSPYISELEEGLTGSGSPKELSTLFELVYLSVTAPRVDPNAFASFMAQQRNQLENRAADPEAAFADALKDVMYNRHPRRRPPTLQQLEKVDMEKALQIYKRRFAAAGDLTFVLVGNVSAETLRPLVETYLASLPAGKKHDRWKDVGAKLVSGPRKLEVRQGIEPKASVVLRFTGATAWSRQLEFDLKALEDALSIRLREVIREELSGSYGVSVSANITRRPRSEFLVTVSFGCAPERVDDLSQKVIEELDKLKQEGLAQDYVTKVKTTLLRQHEVNAKSNGYWLHKLTETLRHGDDFQELLKVPELIESISTARLRDTARKVIDTKRHVRAILRPESQTSAMPSKADAARKMVRERTANASAAAQ